MQKFPLPQYGGGQLKTTGRCGNLARPLQGPQSRTRSLRTTTEIGGGRAVLCSILVGREYHSNCRTITPKENLVGVLDNQASRVQYKLR